MKVENVLAAKNPLVVCIAPSASIRQAVAHLRGHQVGALVVVDDGACPVGILSERDVVRALGSYPDLLNLTVRDLMSAPVLCGTSSDDVDTLLHMMTAAHIRHLPIVDGDELVGLVTLADLVKARLTEARGELDSLQALIIGL